MKTIKIIANIALGIGAILVLNDNESAIYLNIIGVACIAALALINKQRKTETTI